MAGDDSTYGARTTFRVELWDFGSHDERSALYLTHDNPQALSKQPFDVGVGRVTDTQTARVLLVGKRARILDELGSALRDEGLHVREETDIDRVRSINGANLDVVALGRAVRGSKREALVMALRAQNPAVKIVDGLAPIPDVLVGQVQQALTTPSADTRIVADADYEPADNRIVLVLRRATHLEAVLHRLDPLYRAHHEVVYEGPIGRGRQHIPLFRRVGRGELFLVAHADSETTVHPLS